MRFTFSRYLLLFLGLLICNTQVLAKYSFNAKTFKGYPCGNARLISYGPFDYKTAPWSKIKIVLDYHFTPDLARSGNDLNYTLGALPNFHPALLKIIQLYIRNPSEYGKEKFSVRPPECYLYRAIRFHPKDHQTYNLFAYFLYKIKRYEDAVKYYKQAIKYKKKNPEAYYNLGLILIILERYEEARKYAKIAYKQKYPFQGLKRKLKKAGYPL